MSIVRGEGYAPGEEGEDMTAMEESFERAKAGLKDLEQAIEKAKARMYARGYTVGVADGISLVFEKLVEAGYLDAARAEEARARMAEATAAFQAEEEKS